jgi:tetratricopeptide (TPR) repeat protein
VRRTCLAAIALLAVACATYTSKMEHSRDLYYEGRYAEALSGLDRLIADSSGRDRSLLLLERGKVNLALDRYDSAIVDLQAAETKFLDIEATMSVAEIFKNILVNPTMSEYQPEAYEKIMISSYLLLAYWLEGDREGAFVERNRLVGRLKQYTDDLSEEDRASLDVPFARYLAALMYEVEAKTMRGSSTMRSAPSARRPCRRSWSPTFPSSSFSRKRVALRSGSQPRYEATCRRTAARLWAFSTFRGARSLGCSPWPDWRISSSTVPGFSSPLRSRSASSSLDTSVSAGSSSTGWRRGR